MYIMFSSEVILNNCNVVLFPSLSSPWGSSRSQLASCVAESLHRSALSSLVPVKSIDGQGGLTIVQNPHLFSCLFLLPCSSFSAILRSIQCQGSPGVTVPIHGGFLDGCSAVPLSLSSQSPLLCFITEVNLCFPGCAFCCDIWATGILCVEENSLHHPPL